MRLARCMPRSANADGHILLTSSTHLAGAPLEGCVCFVARAFVFAEAGMLGNASRMRFITMFLESVHSKQPLLDGLTPGPPGVDKATSCEKHCRSHTFPDGPYAHRGNPAFDGPRKCKKRLHVAVGLAIVAVISSMVIAVAAGSIASSTVRASTIEAHEGFTSSRIQWQLPRS